MFVGLVIVAGAVLVFGAHAVVLPVLPVAAIVMSTKERPKPTPQPTEAELTTAAGCRGMGPPLGVAAACPYPNGASPHTPRLAYQRHPETRPAWHRGVRPQKVEPAQQDAASFAQ